MEKLVITGPGHIEGELTVSGSKNTALALMSATLVAVPGFILSLTTEDDGFGGSRTAGEVLLAVGVPIAVTVADRLFRAPRPSPPPFPSGTVPR